MKWLISAGLVFGLTVSGSADAEVFKFPALTKQVSSSSLTIYSTTDIDAARPLVDDFQSLYPNVSVFYHDLQSLDLYERVIRESDDNKTTADFVFSSAMDLQMKLTNDGYASRHRSEITDEMPRWSVWRNEAFGVTFEPAVMVYNRKFFENRTVPKTRAGLTEMLTRDHPEFFGKIATYDVQRSGLGLLFLARDVDHYPAIWNLVRAFGRNGVKLYTSTAAILDRVAEGKFVLGYNVLGSYAAARAKRDPSIAVLLPEDFTVVLSRIAMIPRYARSHAVGAKFLDYVLSPRGQRVLAEQAGLNAVHPDVKGDNTADGMRKRRGHSLRPIKVGTGLLVYLDQVKRAKLLIQWEQALNGRQ